MLIYSCSDKCLSKIAKELIIEISQFRNYCASTFDKMIISIFVDFIIKTTLMLSVGTSANLLMKRRSDRSTTIEQNKLTNNKHIHVFNPCVSFTYFLHILISVYVRTLTAKNSSVYLYMYRY